MAKGASGLAGGSSEVQATGINWSDARSKVSDAFAGKGTEKQVAFATNVVENAYYALEDIERENTVFVKMNDGKVVGYSKDATDIYGNKRTDNIEAVKEYKGQIDQIVDAVKTNKLTISRLLDRRDFLDRNSIKENVRKYAKSKRK